MSNQAIQSIEFIHSFLEYPDGLCEEDWRIWRPLIATYCAKVSDEELRKKGVEAMDFLNLHFHQKKQ